MRNPLFIILFVFGTFLLTSCEPVVKFDNPQPEGSPDINKFPKTLIGKYQSLSDNSILTIENKYIYRTSDYEVKYAVNKLDSNITFNGKYIVFSVSKRKFPAEKRGDTIYCQVHDINVLCSLKFNDVLREYSGYYFLNTRSILDKKWTVRKIQIKDGELEINSIRSEDEIKKLRMITLTINDTVPRYNFNPSRNEFKEFIDNNGFSSSERFVKINNK